MRGKDDVKDELFEAMAKSVEGILAEKCYKQQMKRNVRWRLFGQMVTQVLQKQKLHTIQKEKFTGVVDMLVEPSTTS